MTLTSLMTSISGERDSRWAWSWARRLPFLSEDPRWPLDTTLLQEVSTLTSLKQNLALLKVRVRGWTSPEMVDHLPLLCHPHLEGPHLLQADRIRWVNQAVRGTLMSSSQHRISPNMNGLQHWPLLKDYMRMLREAQREFSARSSHRVSPLR